MSKALDEIVEFGWGDRVGEIRGWIRDREGTEVGSALSVEQPKTERLIDAQVDAMCQIMDTGHLNELCRDELRLAASLDRDHD